MAILLFSIGITIAANGIILKPIARISEAIRHVADGDLSQTLDIVRDDELGALAVVAEQYGRQS